MKAVRYIIGTTILMLFTALGVKMVLITLSFGPILPAVIVGLIALCCAISLAFPMFKE